MYFLSNNVIKHLITEGLAADIIHLLEMLRKLHSSHGTIRIKV